MTRVSRISYKDLTEANSICNDVKDARLAFKNLCARYDKRVVAGWDKKLINLNRVKTMLDYAVDAIEDEFNTYSNGREIRISKEDYDND